MYSFLFLDTFFVNLNYDRREMQDPCRPSVKDAVHLCQIAGVKVLLPSF